MFLGTPFVLHVFIDVLFIRARDLLLEQPWCFFPLNAKQMSHSCTIMSIIPSECCHPALLVDWCKIDPQVSRWPIACFMVAI